MNAELQKSDPTHGDSDLYRSSPEASRISTCFGREGMSFFGVATDLALSAIVKDHTLFVMADLLRLIDAQSDGVLMHHGNPGVPAHQTTEYVEAMRLLRNHVVTFLEQSDAKSGVCRQSVE